MWFPPEVMAQWQAAMSGQSQEQAEKKEEAKVKKAEADKKTPEEQLFEAKELVRVSGRQFCGRILGMLDRETGKLTDQFTILEGHEKEVARIVTKSFLIELDIEMRERGYVDDEE
jgi:hypothetical protein